MFTSGQAEALALTVVRSLKTTEPHLNVHLELVGGDISSARQLHPAFHSSYDWHSSVHMHWSLVRLLNRFPELASIQESAPKVLDRSLTVENLAIELAYLQTPGRKSFERPYGWVWLLKLDAELALSTHPRAATWRAALAPLAAFVGESLQTHIQTLSHPIRHGTHLNTAFALVLGLQWARVTAHWPLVEVIETKARAWFGDDMAHGVFWEPSGTDFLSPTLTEALVMSQIVPSAQFADWFNAFLPVALTETPLASAVAVADRKDAQLVHLDGLNLARAWCARGIASVLPLGSPAALALAALAQGAVEQSGAQAIEGDFVATHWLASFLLLAETEFPGIL